MEADGVRIDCPQALDRVQALRLGTYITRLCADDLAQGMTQALC